METRRSTVRSNPRDSYSGDLYTAEELHFKGQGYRKAKSWISWFTLHIDILPHTHCRVKCIIVINFENQCYCTRVCVCVCVCVCLSVSVKANWESWWKAQMLTHDKECRACRSKGEGLFCWLCYWLFWYFQIWQRLPAIRLIVCLWLLFTHHKKPNASNLSSLRVHLTEEQVDDIWQSKKAAATLTNYSSLQLPVCFKEQKLASRPQDQHTPRLTRRPPLSGSLESILEGGAISCGLPSRPLPRV